MNRTGREVHVIRYPRDAVSPADFDIVDAPVAPPEFGEVLVRNTWTSVDPALMLRLREHAPAGYFPAFPLRRAMDGIMTVGVVAETRSEEFTVGDPVSHAQGWREYSTVAVGREQLSGLGTLSKLDVSTARPQHYLGALGGIGLTAYAGLSLVDGMRGGETVWVSAAAGAVGSVVAQLARLHGNRVIASTGSDEKVAWLKETLGVDAAFNYKSTEPADALAELAPDGLDVYFDSVGGGHLEAALDAMKRFGRIALCGSVSEYSTTPSGPRNLFLAVSKDLCLRGYRGSSNLDLLTEARQVIGGHLARGEFISADTAFTGLDQAPAALMATMAGRTLGKTLVSI